MEACNGTTMGDPTGHHPTHPLVEAVTTVASPNVASDHPFQLLHHPHHHVPDHVPCPCPNLVPNPSLPDLTMDADPFAVPCVIPNPHVGEEPK